MISDLKTDSFNRIFFNFANHRIKLIKNIQEIRWLDSIEIKNMIEFYSIYPFLKDMSHNMKHSDLNFV